MKNLQLFGVGMLVGTIMVMCTEAYAEENKITKWLKTEWVKTVEFQKENWAQGKEQLNKNKLYIQDLFAKVKDNVTQD